MFDDKVTYINPSLNCRPYLDSDYFSLRDWFTARKLKCPDRWFFPTTGFISPDVAAGFLYLTNSRVAYIDGYISNPLASKFDISLAVNSITRKIISEAEKQGVKMLCYTSKIKSIQDRAKVFGFSANGTHVGFSKEL